MQRLILGASGARPWRALWRSAAVIAAAQALLVTCSAPDEDPESTGDRPAVEQTAEPAAVNQAGQPPANAAAERQSPGVEPDPPPDLIEGPDGRAWRRLAADGLHDPRNQAITALQQPAEALSTLPPGGPSGNQVDWMEALRIGAIQPRTNIYPETKVRVLDLDIVFTDTAGQPYVVFPHRQHTEWLDCSNCHPGIFVAKQGANDFSMLQVLQGEYCGRCHGAVSFPLTECQRCHSRARPEVAAE